MHRTRLSPHRSPLFGLLSLVACVLFSTVSATSAAADSHEGQAIVVHLSHFSDDLHAASMALSVASELRERGAGVTLFLDLEGVRLADSRISKEMRWGSGPPIAERYAQFVDAGGTVLLCPHCAEYAGIGKGTLRKGARIAGKGEVSSVFLEAAKVIDY